MRFLTTDFNETRPSEGRSSDQWRGSLSRSISFLGCAKGQGILSHGKLCASPIRGSKRLNVDLVNGQKNGGLYRRNGASGNTLPDLVIDVEFLDSSAKKSEMGTTGNDESPIRSTVGNVPLDPGQLSADLFTVNGAKDIVAVLNEEIVLGDVLSRNEPDTSTSGIELGWFNDSTTIGSTLSGSLFGVSSSTFPSVSQSSSPTLAPSISATSTVSDNYTSISDLFVFEDLNDYINQLNYSAFVNLTAYYDGGANLNLNGSANCTTGGVGVRPGECGPTADVDEKTNANSWWALILVIVPCLTLFGNVLVILAVVRERALQTVTNYFIVSLAVADLLVAVLVMPFAVYVLVNGSWNLPGFVCDFYIAMDVTCSTSSIFNLVAISIDRYIAVTQPIKYAKHKNNRRVWLTILLVWAISAAIGSPIVLGLNNTPHRVPDKCLFYNADFIIYSSLSSFYIPCIIMVFLYYNIFKALRNRARKARANRKPNLGDIKPGSIIENIAHTRRAVAQAQLDGARNTRQDSGYDGAASSTAVHEPLETNSSPSPSPNPRVASAPSSSTSSSPPPRSAVASQCLQPKKNGAGGEASKQELKRLKSAASLLPLQLGRTPSVLSASSGCKKDTKNAATGSRFTIYKANKASKKKREKSSAKKERKATKTLAIVLGVFLICWLPFFTCNIMDAICTKLEAVCQPGVTAFIVTSWLGYMNSFVNPVIYTVFNPEFRKAFHKLVSF